MAKFPRVPVTLNHGWYLAPCGRDDPDAEKLAPAPCDGSAAFCYLPAYNATVRDGYVEKGFVLLSACRGDIADKGSRALIIGPPSDESLAMAINELARRVGRETARLQQDIVGMTELIDESDVSAAERRIYRSRRQQLKRVLEKVGQGIPTLAEARVFFVREYQMRTMLGMPEDARKFAAAQRQGEALSNMVSAAQLAAHQEQMNSDPPKREKKEPVGV